MSRILNGTKLAIAGFIVLCCRSPRAFCEFPDVGSWELTTLFPVAAYQYDPVEYNGYVYVAGGWAPTDRTSLDSVFFAALDADGSLSSWQETTPLPEPDQGPGAAIWNGHIYVALGHGQIYRASIACDGTLGNWQAEATAAPDHGGRMSLEAYKGYLYVLGGHHNGTFYADVFVAPINPDGSVASWVLTTAMPEPRQHQSVHFYRGRVYIVGGITEVPHILETSYSAPVNPNGTLGAWRQEASLAHPLWYHSSVLANNRILLFGGLTQYAGGPVFDIYEGVIAENGTISAWTDTGDMPSDYCSAPGAVYAPSHGTAYLIGGVRLSDLTATAEVWHTPGTDCNVNGIPDVCDLAAMLSEDCNENGVPDECDIAAGTSADCNTNGTPDECETGLFPTVAQQPQAQTVPVGSPAYFSVVATGYGTLTYQWRRNGVPLIDGDRISGATTPTLTIDPTWVADSGSYDVVIADDCGAVTSAVATLTVTANLGDLNCDGVVDFDDINAFVLAIQLPSEYVNEYPNCDRMLGDCNGDAYVDFNDINCFVALLSAG